MTAFLIGWAVFLGILITSAAFAAGIKVGHRKALREARWDRWILRSEAQRRIRL